jgi:hypothetical protein
MSLLDLERCEPFLAELKVLAAVLWEEATYSDDELKIVHEAFTQTAGDQVEPLVDLHAVCTTLQRSSANQRIREAATSVLALLHDPAFLVEHAVTGPRFDRLHGISVYAPHVFTEIEWPDLNVSAETRKVLGLERSAMWASVAVKLREAAQAASV